MIDDLGFQAFPTIPHLAAPPAVQLRADKILTEEERGEFLAATVVVEEKIDGENLGISFDGERLRFQARGSYIELGGRRFKGLKTWIAPRASYVVDSIGSNLVVFGEWCATAHTVSYDRLPDWFLVFDVYDHTERKFWSIERRDRLVEQMGLHAVPKLTEGRFDVGALRHLIGRSAVGSETMEGVVVRRSTPTGSGLTRAKLVREDFVQSIGEHWMSRQRVANRLAMGR